MVAIGAARRKGLPARALQQRATLGHDQAPGGGQRHRGDLPAEGTGAQRIAPDRAVGGEVADGEDSPVGARGGLDARRQRAGGERRGTPLGVCLERGGEFRKADDGPGRRRLAAGQPERGAFREARQDVALFGDGVVQARGHREAVPRQAQGRSHHLRPAQPAEPVVQLEQA